MDISTKDEGIAEGYLSACEQENRELYAENRRLAKAFRETIELDLTEIERLRAALAKHHVAAHPVLPGVSHCPTCGYVWPT